MNKSKTKKLIKDLKNFKPKLPAAFYLADAKNKKVFKFAKTKIKPKIWTMKKAPKLRLSSLAWTVRIGKKTLLAQKDVGGVLA